MVYSWEEAMRRYGKAVHLGKQSYAISFRQGDPGVVGPEK